MVWIPGGEFAMGSDHHYPEEAPVHRASVDGFWMDRCAVTNRDFARFVEETGHVTVAERPPDAADYPDACGTYLTIERCRYFIYPDSTQAQPFEVKQWPATTIRITNAVRR